MLAADGQTVGTRRNS